MDYLGDFVEHMRSMGYEPKRAVKEGGQWNRLYYNGEKKGRDSGRCFIVIDGDRAYGSFGSDKDPNYFTPWTSWNPFKLTDAEREANNAWMDRVNAERKARDKRIAERLQRRLKDVYKGMQKAPDDHPYLLGKQVKAHKKLRYRQRTSELIIPVYQMLGKGKSLTMTSLQKITPKGGKFFLRGGNVSGGFFPMVEKAAEWDKIYIAEGYSTAATIKEQIGGQVIVAFNAGNMKKVAKIFAKKYKDSEIVLLADNDQFKSDKWPEDRPWINTGLSTAEKLSEEIGARVAAPEFKDADLDSRPTDWNDFFCLYGSDALSSVITSVKQDDGGACEISRPPEPPPVPATIEPTMPDVYGASDNWMGSVRFKNKERGILDKNHSAHNAILWLTHDKKFEGMFIYNMFTHSRMINKPMPWDNPSTFKPREIEEEDLTQLRAAIGLNDIIIGSNTEMQKILNVVAGKNSMNPVKKYFERIEWDGVPRLDSWLIDYCGATQQDQRYVAEVGSCFLKAGVKRVYNPGEKFDHMLVLEGGQAAGKSTALRYLATLGGEEFFSDQLRFSMLDNPHVFLELKGNLIIEFAELSGLSKKDANTVKGWITQQTDRWTPKFSNTPTEYPRQFILAGSTNDTEWLNDPTGGRRFWPVKVANKINTEGLKEVVEQLWAEAVYRVKAGEQHYIDVKSEVYKIAQNEQSERYEGGVWEDVISKYLDRKRYVVLDDIMRECLRKDIGTWTIRDKRDVSKILKTLGWENKTVRTNCGQALKAWAPKNND